MENLLLSLLSSDSHKLINLSLGLSADIRREKDPRAPYTFDPIPVQDYF